MNDNFVANVLTEKVIATDILNSAKTSIKNYAYALTETHSSEVRNTLKKQLNATIDHHEKISNYVISNGYYVANDLNEQIRLDLNSASKTLNIQV